MLFELRYNRDIIFKPFVIKQSPKGNCVMKEKRALSKNQFLQSGFDSSQYKLMDTEGTFSGILDMKRWGKSFLTSYFTLDNGRKMHAATFLSNQYYGLPTIPLGSRVTIIFKKVKTNNIYIKGVVAEKKEHFSPYAVPDINME